MILSKTYSSHDSYSFSETELIILMDGIDGCLKFRLSRISTWITYKQNNRTENKLITNV